MTVSTSKTIKSLDAFLNDSRLTELGAVSNPQMS